VPRTGHDNFYIKSILVMLVVSWSGCSTAQPYQDPVNLATYRAVHLALCGFDSRKATTEKQARELEQLPQNSMQFYRDEKNRLIYWLADARICNCIYFGDEIAYQRLQQTQPQTSSIGEPQVLNPYSVGLSKNWDLSVNKNPIRARMKSNP